MEEDGVFGEPALRAWKQAEGLWDAFGDRTIPTVNGIVHLNEFEHLENESQRLRHELDALAPGLRAKMEDKRRLALPEKLQAALRLDLGKRSPEQSELAADAESQVEVDNMALARQIEDPNRPKASHLGKTG